MKPESIDVKSVFAEAIEKTDARDRAVYLDRICGQDTTLRAEVESLLMSYGQIDDFLPSPDADPSVTLDSASLVEGPGMVVGRYKLLERIGEGGMATVYMAEQTEPMRRKVAFKIIKLGMDTKQVIARFEAERQALAMLDHPNIAKVFDAGATETGRPFFVMELVRGTSITEYCDNHRLSTSQRLQLFVRVCHAVQHAHHKGIIHRDLKPSNVMVTMHDDKPVPKVIDFGIAKATNQRLTEKTLFTRYAHMIGTPAYMSPEQAQMNGLDVDTRTDIYSLGVLLYELLTGTPPFAPETLQQAGYAELERIIRETDPPKPSTRLRNLDQKLAEVARWRQTNGEALRKSVKGDLDCIVMKCLEKDRTRRYETPHALIEDLERHLRCEPILAHSQNGIYRLCKFARRRRKLLAVATVVIGLLLGLVITAMMLRRASALQWARGEAVPAVAELVRAGDYAAAFPLARKARRIIPTDATLVELWSRICKPYSVTTTPPGAAIWYRTYTEMDAPWQYLGQSPVENVTLADGIYRWRLQKEGFATHECVVDHSFEVRLQEESPGDEMVWVGAWTADVYASSYSETTPVEASAYLIDKYEVTNRQYKQFVDRGGYSDPAYWEGLEFIWDDRQLSWQAAMAEFVDQTGQPGPSTWKNGTYPDGQDTHPVSGVSWYEANAYARFAGKSLPTVHHWQRAACLDEALVLVGLSNFDITGTAPVGSYPGVAHTGLYDMAGNVKEWCLNATDHSGRLRHLLGGGWGERTYMFTVEDSRTPWDRLPVNGFRCVRYPQGDASLASALLRPIKLYPQRDLSNLVAFSDQEWQVLKSQYEYDPTPLNPVVESTDDGPPFWRREKITFDAAYGNERVIAYLFLPKTGKPPYQTVIYFPGISAVYDESFDGLEHRDVTEYLITSGRALLFPIYKGTYERPAACGRVWTMTSVMETPMAYRDWTIKMAKDLSRSIDYLETRNDIDSSSIAYYGLSWGSTLGPIMLAVEERFETGIFVVGGIPPIPAPRSFDIALYAQRVTAPVLMVNGREDVLLPLKTAQTPMHELLGTPKEHKEHKLYPGGHAVFGLFHQQIRTDVLTWLDRYLGPIGANKSDATRSENAPTTE